MNLYWIGSEVRKISNFTAIFPPLIILKGFRRRNDPSREEAVAAGADNPFLSLSPSPTDSKLIACPAAEPCITYPYVILLVLIMRDRRRFFNITAPVYSCSRTNGTSRTTSAIQWRSFRRCLSRSIDGCYVGWGFDE